MRGSRRFAGLFALVLMASLAMLPAIPASATHGGDTEVTVGSNDHIFSQNKQNEPAVAIDPSHPFLIAAGANDNIDLEACNAGTPNTCPFTPGVGTSGVQFSFNSGDLWMQPEYTGYSAREACLGDPDPAVTTDVCVPDPDGPIGTLPWYFENDLVSNGDPALAFGPVPGANSEFSWDNGSRLYYANLAGGFPGALPFKGVYAIAVSRLDFPSGLTPATAADVVADQENWRDPVVASKQSATTFSDKEQISVDNAASSRFFGNAYVCIASFRSASRGRALPTPLIVARSTDGGDSWTTKQVTDATNNPFNPKKGFGRSGCTIRTDAAGVVYILANQFAVGTPGFGKHIMIRSFDGGQRWTRPVELFTAVDTCFSVQFDGTSFRCVMDGLAGARDDLSSSPSLDVSNGAPTGAVSTGFLYDTWVDGRSGRAGPPVDNQTQLRFAYSTNRGGSWTQSIVPIAAGDRPYYSAVAVSPDGQDLYLVYNAFTNAFRDDTTSARGLVGVILHANVTASGAPGAWSEVHRGATGDPRGSSQNNIVLEFLGDYVYADATNDYGVAVWNDVRQASTCDDVNDWRADVQEAGPPLDASGRPAIQQVCPSTFGNSDIRGWSGADPT
jgi:hypothetical protein